MPRVTISITTPEQTSDSDILSMELPPSLAIQDLKGLIEAEKGHPAASQHLYWNGHPLNTPTQTLEDAGIQDGEMLAVLIRRPGNPPRRQPPRDHHQPQRRPGVADPEGVRQTLLGNPAQLESVRQRHPQLAQAVNDPDRFRQLFYEMADSEAELERERQRQIALLNEDPFNIEAQRKIEDIIRQEGVINNLQYALEENPEVFGRVHMLYVNTEVNGVPVKAFVDSGAQATIMSPDCAERCGIMRLMDTRFSGMAKGVGTARILGRVHSADIQVGGFLMKCAFTVMEGKDVELLFGLDMLKRYRAKIDLEKNALCFEGVEVPFLPENEIPKGFEESEPTVEGPNGTQIGTKSGAVMPPPEPQAAAASSSSSSSAPKPAPAPAPVDSAPESSSASQVPQKDIDTLVGLGFSRYEAAKALEATGGNVEFAASLLFSRQ